MYFCKSYVKIIPSAIAVIVPIQKVLCVTEDIFLHFESDRIFGFLLPSSLLVVLH